MVHEPLHKLIETVIGEPLCMVHVESLQLWSMLNQDWDEFRSQRLSGYTQFLQSAIGLQDGAQIVDREMRRGRQSELLEVLAVLRNVGTSVVREAVAKAQMHFGETLAVVLKEGTKMGVCGPPYIAKG